MSEGEPIWRRLREPAIQAALANGAVVLTVPLAFLIYVDSTSDVVRPYPPAIWRSALNALPVLVVTIPVYDTLPPHRAEVLRAALRGKPTASTQPRTSQWRVLNDLQIVGLLTKQHGLCDDVVGLCEMAGLRKVT